MMIMMIMKRIIKKIVKIKKRGMRLKEMRIIVIMISKMRIII